MTEGFSKGPVHKLKPGYVRWEVVYRVPNLEGGWTPRKMWKTAKDDEDAPELIARELYQRVISKGIAVDIISIKNLGDEVPIQNTGEATQVITPKAFEEMHTQSLAKESPKDLQDRAREHGWPRLADTLTQKRIDKILKGEA